MGDQWKPDDKPVFTNHDVLYQQAPKILEVIYRDLEKTSMEPDASESLSRLQTEADWTQTPLFFLISSSVGVLQWFPCLPPGADGSLGACSKADLRRGSRHWEAYVFHTLLSSSL